MNLPSHTRSFVRPVVDESGVGEVELLCVAIFRLLILVCDLHGLIGKSALDAYGIE